MDSSNTPTFNGCTSATLVPRAGTWTVQLFSTTGYVASAAMAISWP